ncbi:MAG: YaaA family protein [Magnetococcus sp. YQC-5]
MLALISPAKTLDLTPATLHRPDSWPKFEEEARLLVDLLRPLTMPELADMLGVSQKLAQVNIDRFHFFSATPSFDQIKPAALLYRGDT